MANRFPLIVDAANTANSIIKELPSGDYMDLTSSGASNIAVANLQITGGSNGQVLSTGGSGNLSWASAGGGSSSNVAAGEYRLFLDSPPANAWIRAGNIQATYPSWKYPDIANIANLNTAPYTQYANSSATWFVSTGTQTSTLTGNIAITIGAGGAAAPYGSGLSQNGTPGGATIITYSNLIVRANGGGGAGVWASIGYGGSWTGGGYGANGGNGGYGSQGVYGQTVGIGGGGGIGLRDTAGGRWIGANGSDYYFDFARALSGVGLSIGTASNVQNSGANGGLGCGGGAKAYGGSTTRGGFGGWGGGGGGAGWGVYSASDMGWGGDGGNGFAIIATTNTSNVTTYTLYGGNNTNSANHAIPANTTSIKAWAVGGGGGGGSAYFNSDPGAGGGGGALAYYEWRV